MRQLECPHCGRAIAVMGGNHGSSVSCLSCGEKVKPPDWLLADLARPLGDVVAVHRYDRLTLVVNSLVGIGAFGLNIGVAFVFFGRGADGATAIAVFMLTVILSGLGIMMIRGAVRSNRTRVTVYQAGLVVVNPPKVLSFPWEAIAACTENRTRHTYHFIPIMTEYGYRLKREDGLEAEISGNISRHKQLAESIREKLFQHKLPSVLDAIQRGTGISFGPILLGPEGITFRQKFLPWLEVKSVKLEGGSGTFRIEKKGAWFTWACVPMAEVQDNLIFPLVIDGILKEFRDHS